MRDSTRPGCWGRRPGALVLAEENVQAALAGKTVRKLVVVPGRIVNIVAG